MPAPHDFWTVLQKMGPDFAMSLGFWAVSCGRGSLQRLPTWGNAGSSRPFKPKPPAKPPRSSEQDCTMRKPALPMQSTCASIRANHPNPQHEAPARTLGTKSASALHPRQCEVSPDSHTKATGATRPRPNAARCKFVKTAIVLRRTAILVRDRPGRPRLIPFTRLRTVAKRLETMLLDAAIEIVLNGDVRHRGPHALETFYLPAGLGKHPSAAPRLLGIVNPLRIRRMRRAPIEGRPSILEGF